MPRKKKPKGSSFSDSIKGVKRRNGNEPMKGIQPVSPLWELERDGIQQSGISKWLECPEQFALEYIEGMTSTSLQVPIEFGSVFHLCLERQFEQADPHLVAEEVCSYYLKNKLPKLASPKDRQSLEQLVASVQVMFPYYCQYWTKQDATYDWIAREEKFGFDYLVDPELTVHLKGMRDGVYRDGKGRLCLFETKTKSRIDEEAIADIVRCDLQLMMYCLALHHDYGEWPSMAKYNVIRRPAIYWRKNDTVSDYCSRLNEDVKKRPEHYFMRWNIEVTQQDIEYFERVTLKPVLRNFHRWWTEVKKNPFQRELCPYHIMNSNALVGKYGKATMYDYIVKGRTTGYEYRKSPFPELV